MEVILGRDNETRQLITVGDVARCGGLYLLGKPRTGKSTLMISLALQDMEHGHGLLFIDPHSDAIAALLARIPPGREEDVILLDPSVEACAFGINLLTCKNPNSYQELAFSYGLARDLFVKVFGDPLTGELGILLDKYLRNSLYPLLENPGHTLVDIEPFLTNKSFRNRLLRHVTMNPAVISFWQEQYEQLPYKDQIQERESTLNRLNIILAEPRVRHIVGQVKTTIDFTEILKTRKIVLLRMPVGMDEGVKTFIGTLIISQLLKAVWLRQEMPEAERGLFALYCDEFQHFATPDFAKLFTQTGKFRIMPTVAHQERLGQFKPQDPNRGATLAAPNKVLFSLAVADSRELSPEFAKPPPIENRREAELVISQEPVPALLRGHIHPFIRAFVNCYLRSLKEKQEDIRDEMEIEKLIREDLRDQAAIERLYAQMEGLHRQAYHYNLMHKYLQRAEYFTEQARARTGRLITLFDTVRNIRLLLRRLNKLFVEIMEGRFEPKAGNEEFSRFIVERVLDSPHIQKQHKNIFELFIQLSYGDPARLRVIPFEFARAHGFFPQEISKIQQDVEVKIEQHKRESMMKDLHSYLFLREGKQARVAAYKVRGYDEYTWSASSVCVAYLYYFHYPALQTLLKPYLTARFAPSWKFMIPNLDKLIQQICDKVDTFSEYSEGFERIKECVYVKEPLIGFLIWFLEHWREGFLVVLSLLKLARYQSTWEGSDYVSGNLGSSYPGLNMLWLPKIVGRQPIEIFQLAKRMNEIMLLAEKSQTDFFSYFNFDNFFRTPKDPDVRKYEVEESQYDRWLCKRGLGVGASPFFSERMEERIGLQMLTLELQLRQDWLSKQLSKAELDWWNQLDEAERRYFLLRACDIACLGTAVADRTWPQPVMPGLATERVSHLISLLVTLLTDVQKEAKEVLKRESDERLLKSFSSEPIPNPLLLLPDNLAPRTISDNEIERLKTACLKELEQGGWNVKGMLIVIEDFINFCQLLSRPENHTLIPSGQYVWKAVNTRSYADMEVEMAWALTNLPNRVALAKVAREQEGRQVVLKRQIQTFELPPVRLDKARLEWTITRRSYSRYYQERRKIEEDISQKEKKRLGLSLDAPPPEAASQRQKEAAPPPGEPVTTVTQGELSQPALQLPEPDAPPPAGLATRRAEDTPLKREDKTGDAPLEELKFDEEAEDVRQAGAAALIAVTDRPVPTSKEALPKDEAAKVQTASPPGAELLYRSNFYLPDDKWLEGNWRDGKIRLFRRDGCYNMAISLSEWWIYHTLSIPLVNFRIHVNAQFMTLSGNSAYCGVVFRANKDYDEHSFYCFTILPSGNYGLFVRVNEHWETILDYRPSEFIRRGDSSNSLLVEMAGQKITLGINGHCLATLLDSRLSDGCVGLLIGTGSNDSCVEVRFCDFRLYGSLSSKP